MRNFKANKIKASWSEGKVINETTVHDIRKAKLVDGDLDYKNEPYFAMICGAYIASFLCGISLLNLKESDTTPKIITSIARYHIYYQIRKFMYKPKLIDSCNVGDVRKYIPIKQTIF